jgi:hypothetical protein
MKKLFIITLLLFGCGAQNYNPLEEPGPQGPPGTPGSQVSMVQFCTNYNTNYPSTFPEYGFCINGILYATYWNGTDAWTAEIVPGNYESTSTSAPCNFIVYNNCIVTDY